MRILLALLLAALNCGTGTSQSTVLSPGPSTTGGQTVNINAVHGATLADVIAMLAHQSRQNIIISPMAGAQPVVLSLHGVDAHTALVAIERTYNLTETRSGDVLILTSPTETTITTSKVISVPLGGAAEIAAYAQARYGAAAVVSAIDPTTAVIAGTPATVDDLNTIATQLGKHGFSIEAVPTQTDPQNVIAGLSAMNLITGSMPIFADRSNYRLVIVGSTAARDALKKVIPLADVLQKQVVFDIDIIEWQPQNDNYNIGPLIGTPTTTNSNGSSTITVSPGTVTVLGGPGLPHGIPFGATLNLLVSNGNAKILSKPRVALMNNQSTSLQIGSNYPIAATNGGLVGGQTIQYYKVGILLSLSASINSDDAVTTNINATESDISGFDPTSNLPIVATNTAQSQIRVGDGNDIILAGFFRDAATNTITKIPGLGDIPIIGRFFQDRVMSHTKSEIIFRITPHVKDADTLMSQPNTIGGN